MTSAVESNGEVEKPAWKFFVKSWGCSSNFSDGEVMAGVLKSAGFELVPDWSEADVVVANSCTVVNPSELHFWTFVKQCVESNKSLVLAGCVLQAENRPLDAALPIWLRPFKAQIAVLGPRQLTTVAAAAAQLLTGECGTMPINLGDDGIPQAPPKIRGNCRVEIVPICYGCRGACTYCKTRFARGALKSKPIAQIVEEAKQAYPFTELWLTGQDTSAYGLDIDASVPQLIDALISALPDHIKIRIGMANPDHILPDLGNWTRMFMNHPQLYRFLHLPVQSGSNAVLKRMNRKYTAEQFEQLVDGLRAAVPDITIMTDVIAGFPGETDEDWVQTLALLTKLQLPFVNITRFYSRPHTPAAKMKQVDSKVTKRRTKELTGLDTRKATLDALVGHNMPVVVTDRAYKGSLMVGHTPCYIQVLLPLDEALLEAGATVQAEIVSAGAWSVEGRVIKQ
ncbi:Methylthiotransferase [Carpediemonas membranifera]|uniref:Threonylcarbamoyladenosine tRNA methylthiotransferase n=1 Tax=Carpediemonas membranifera TaxID=201153 RepID=A0A8J6E688_9EUKA|nr:Methylthiotransferase [Carpediemonas membranifera]|eukprot:KAG9396802.1 Methylthiotransferase [Carpediemonas membranifera]